MNKRIEELCKQAGISILYEYDGYDGHAAVANLADIQKFAQLIVDECAETAEDTAMGEPTYGWMVADRIREYFGTNDD